MTRSHVERGPAKRREAYHQLACSIFIRLNLDKTTADCVLPYREARARTPPRVHRLGVVSRSSRDPFQQLQRERSDFIHVLDIT